MEEEGPDFSQFSVQHVQQYSYFHLELTESPLAMLVLGRVLLPIYKHRLKGGSTPIVISQNSSGVQGNRLGGRI